LDELPPYALEFMDQTFTQHDQKAATSLVLAAPNEWRGQIALCAYWLGIPNPAYRAIVRGVWDHDHGQLRSITTWFAAPATPRPIPSFSRRMSRNPKSYGLISAQRVRKFAGHDDFPCQRSGTAEPPTSPRRWQHATACDVVQERPPTVYWSNERRECEVILRSTPPIRLDDQPEHWQEIANSVTEERAFATHLALASRQPKF
jgi:hypothetical protein